MTKLHFSLSHLWHLQNFLKKYIDLNNRLSQLRYLGGADVDYKNGEAKAAVCLLKYENLNLVEVVTHQEKVFFPYHRGYLAFREGFILLRAIEKLKTLPDCFIFDGNGILHPRSLGLATFMGIILKVPSIGCAKRLSLGQHKRIGKTRGSFSSILYRGKVLGIALRTKEGVRQVYISCGWGISLKKAKEVILKSSIYRIPEPLRLAHIYSRR